MRRIMIHASLALLLGCGAPGLAGWDWTNPLPQGSDLRDVAGCGAGCAFAVGDHGALLAGDGASWMPLPSPTRADLHGVFALGAEDFYVAGEDGVWRWNGSWWHMTDASLWSGAPYPTDLWGSAADDLYALSDDSPRAYHWDGQDWSPAFQGSADLNAIHGTGPDRICIAGDGPRMYEWDGSVWTELYLPDEVPGLPGGSHAISVRAFPGGALFLGLDGGEVLRRRNDVWTVWGPASTNERIEGLYGSSAADLYALACTPPTGPSSLLRWDGQDWSPVPPEIPGYLHGCDGWGTSLLAAGRFGRLDRWDNGTHTPMSWAAEEDLLQAVWAPPASESLIAVGTRGAILRWDGSAWQPDASGISRSLMSVWGTSNDRVMAVGEQGTILRWDGSAWTVDATGVDRLLRDVHAAGAQGGLAVGEGGTILRWDGGAWSPDESGVTRALTAVWSQDGSIAYAAAVSGEILRYNGADWLSMPSPPVRGHNDLLGFGADRLVAVGWDGAAYYDGSDWEILGDSPSRLLAVWGTGPNNLWAAGDGGRAFHWNGQTWEPLLTPTGNRLEGVWGTPSGEVFTVGHWGTALRYDPTDRLHARISIPARYVSPGEPFGTRLYLENLGPGTESNAAVFTILEVYGYYYFWPRWSLWHPPESQSIDFDYMDVPVGTTGLEIIPVFTWPDTGSDSLAGLYFYGAMLDPGLSTILGDLSVVEWGYGP